MHGGWLYDPRTTRGYKAMDHYTALNAKAMKMKSDNLAVEDDFVDERFLYSSEGEDLGAAMGVVTLGVALVVVASLTLTLVLAPS